AYRARKGLREAYLQAHLKAEASEECRATVSRLGNYVRGDLVEKERVAVQTHLDSCAKCRCRRDELTDVNATLRNAFLPVPLLLAGLQRKAFNFTHLAGSLFDKAPDISQTAPLADNPLVHKALAGLTMMVLALSGSAVPTVMHQNDKPAQVAQAISPAVSASVGDALRVVSSAVPTGEARAATPSRTESAPAAPAEAATPAAAAPEADPTYRDVSGGSRSKLLFSGRDSAPNRPGGTRSSIIHRPDGSEGGGLLAGTPVGGVLDSALSTVSQAVPLPVDVTISVPGVTGALDAPLSVTAQLPAGQSVAVQVPPALSGVLGGVLQPVSTLLLGGTP
ncbi:MAG: zf-HC2 domain-containing protein, partial [Actinobacteria bacterium]|nr:zf-HC2 domain-containing protein [Actinomycetota bacterium]